MAAIKRGVNARLIGSIIVEGLVFVRVWALNQWGARKLNYKIQELHRMRAMMNNKDALSLPALKRKEHITACDKSSGT